MHYVKEYNNEVITYVAILNMLTTMITGRTNYRSKQRKVKKTHTQDERNIFKNAAKQYYKTPTKFKSCLQSTPKKDLIIFAKH